MQRLSSALLSASPGGDVPVSLRRAVRVWGAAGPAVLARGSHSGRSAGVVGRSLGGGAVTDAPQVAGVLGPCSISGAPQLRGPLGDLGVLHAPAACGGCTWPPPQRPLAGAGSSGRCAPPGLQVPCTEQEAQQPSCRRVPCCWRRGEAVPPECDRVPGAGRGTLQSAQPHGDKWERQEAPPPPGSPWGVARTPVPPCAPLEGGGDFISLLTRRLEKV